MSLVQTVPRVVFGFGAEEKSASNGQRHNGSGPSAKHWRPLHEPREPCSVRLVIRHHQSDEANEIREDTKAEHWSTSVGVRGRKAGERGARNER